MSALSSRLRCGRAAPDDYVFGEGVESDPGAIDLNVDAALLLQHMVGIDSYPPVLASMPDTCNIDDGEGCTLS